MKELKLVKEGNYWTLYIGELQCGCGDFGDMIEAISTLTSWKEAEDFAEKCNEVF